MVDVNRKAPPPPPSAPLCFFLPRNFVHVFIVITFVCLFVCFYLIILKKYLDWALSCLGGNALGWLLNVTQCHLTLNFVDEMTPTGKNKVSLHKVSLFYSHDFTWKRVYICWSCLSASGPRTSSPLCSVVIQQMTDVYPSQHAEVLEVLT